MFRYLEMTILRFQHWDIHLPSLLPALRPLLAKLHALRTLKQSIFPRLVLNHVLQEHLPLDLERIIKDLVIRHPIPTLSTSGF
jgi:hypothetical protein